MKTFHRTRLALANTVFCTAFGVCAHADIVTDWNDLTLAAIRADKTPPPMAARALAIVHAAMFDSVNGIVASHERYLVAGRPAGPASVEAAASAAARLALVRLFPAQQNGFDTAHAKALEKIANSPEKNAGVQWGEWVANAIFVARATDGGSHTIAFTPGDTPGLWKPTEPALAPALLPQWPKVTCFAMDSGPQFRPHRPPSLTSSTYAFDFNLTKQLGAKNSVTRSVEQTAIAQFWADGPGTVTPPGHWNVIARDIAIQRGLSTAENARLFALLNIAAADAAILCWDCKYAVNFWRPITAIRAAETDGNPATEPDANWTPLLNTPPFPEYTSGHSTFSGAAATVLADFFGGSVASITSRLENIRFTAI